VHELRQLLDAKLSRLGNLQGKEEEKKKSPQVVTTAHFPPFYGKQFMHSQLEAV
jgi:hypothetical protein